jgi:DNA topoisomerase-1
VDPDGAHRAIESDDVNEYLRAVSGYDFTAKDFRTWAGTVLGAVALGAADPCTSDAHARRVIADAVKRVAERLGNTPAICRKCYIHLEIFTGYQDGSLHHALDGRIRGRRSRAGLSAAERSVLEFLRQRLEV